VSLTNSGRALVSWEGEEKRKGKEKEHFRPVSPIGRPILYACARGEKGSSSDKVVAKGKKKKIEGMLFTIAWYFSDVFGSEAEEVERSEPEVRF